MAKEQLPGFKQIRDLLYSKNVPVEEITAAADELTEAERFSDALDLYEESGDLERVRAICARALSEGDVGIWMKARKILKEAITPDEWRKIADIALIAEKPHFALFAYKRAGDEQKVEELSQKISGVKAPPAPKPKETT
jgi:G3E family GTPase